MPRPPAKPSIQDTFIHTAIRMPLALREDIAASATLHSRSMNAEILARLEAAPLADRIAELVMRENAELRRLIQKLLDK